MAGIFANIDSDISKIRQLKSEIEKVKKALTSINVKVDIDIAKGMEAQLKSLTAQYDALVQKVAQADAKIAESTARINKSAETVIKAQEQMTKAASGQGASNAQGTSGGNTTATNAQTASVQAQAKAYDELKDAIEGYLGTMEGNARYIAETESAISNVKKNISLLRKEIDAKGGIANEAQLNNLAHYTEELERLKIQLQDARRDLKTDLRINVAGEGSLAQLRNQLLQMQRVWDGMVESVRNSPIGQEFAKSIDVLNKQVSELEQTMGRYQRNVGNYASGWNGLSMSIQQIGRELPSLAMGWNTFFLAISNNLPILTDEIKRAKDEYNNLKKAGQQATPVWKQVVSSLLSWQTALTVGITLLTLYGGEIINWAKGLFNAEKQIDTVKEVSKSFNETMLKGAQDAQSEIVQLNLLYKAATDASKGLDERNKAVDELQKKYPSYFGDLSDEVILLGNAKTAYDKLSQSILASAKARAAVETMKDNEKELITLNTQLELAQQNLESAKRLQELQQSGNIRNTAGAAFAPTSAGSKELADAADEVRKYESEITGLQAKINTLTASNQKLAESVNIGDLLFNPSEGGGGKNDIANAKSYLDELAKLREDNENREIDLMKEGTEKQLAEINLRYDREIEAVKKLRAELEQAQGGKLTTEQVSTFDAAVAGIEAGRKRDTGNVWNEKINRQEQAWNRYLQEYGTFQQKRQAITEEYNRKMAEATTAGEASILQKQMEESLKEIDFNEFKGSINFADVFGNLDAQTTDALKSLREKLGEYINQAAKELRPEDLKELQDAFNQIDFKMAERDPFGELKQSVGEYKEAAREVEQAQKDLDTVMQGGEVITGLYTDEMGKLTKRTLSQEEAEKRLTDAQKKRQESLSKLTASANSIGRVGTQVVNAGNEIVDMLGAFGVSVSEEVAGALDGLGQVMSGLESIDLTKPFSALTGSVTILTGMGKTIASIFGLGGADYSGYESMKNQYENLINVWDTLIGKKMEYINIDYGMEAQKAADEAARLVETQINRQRQLIKQLASSGSGVGSHSLGVRIYDRLNAQDWERISELVGEKIDHEYQIWDLSAEQIEKILTDEKLVSVLDTVNSEFVTYLQNIVDYGNQLDEIAEKEKEAITGIGFESFRDSYVDLLTDLDSTNEDFADSFKKYLQESILSSLVANQYKDRIQALYDSWAKLGKDGINPKEAEKLRQEYQQIANDLLAERDKLMNDFGWDTGTSSQQSATAGGFETMTQDQASELNGRFTALYESSLRQEAIQQGIGNIAEDARNIIAQSYLELQQISENTGAIIKPIRQIQEDIAEVRRNTAKI